MDQGGNVGMSPSISLGVLDPCCLEGYGVAPMQPHCLLNDDGKLAVLKLEQGGSLKLRFLRSNLRGGKVDCSALPTNSFSFLDIPIAEVTLTDEAKVTDDRWPLLHFSDCLINLQFR
jgi:hypothetical protein